MAGLATWDRLGQQQRELYEASLLRVETLEAQMKELQHELSTCKAALTSSSEELDETKSAFSELERSVQVTASSNASVVAIIDGDGYHFAPKYFQQGRIGGQNAAKALKAKLTAEFGLGTPLLVFIYLSRVKLAEFLFLKSVIQQRTDLDDFIVGFNQASPLLHIIDAGPGKETADAKIRDMCKHFSMLLYTRRVYFAGAHDGGYATFLRSLRTDGLLHKIVLLRSSTPFARAIAELGLDELDVQDIFSGFNSLSYPEQPPEPKVLPPFYVPHAYSAPLPFDLSTPVLEHAPLPPNDPWSSVPPSPILSASQFQNRLVNTSHNPPQPAFVSPESRPAARSKPIKRGTGAKYVMCNIEPPPDGIRDGRSILKQHPPLCRSFYLHPQGCFWENCLYSHDHRPTVEEIALLRARVAKMPCPRTGKGRPKPCPDPHCLYCWSPEQIKTEP